MQTLPIPPLKQTLERFVAGISPLLNQQQCQETQAAALCFEQQGGPKLQQRLSEYAATQATKGLSWLTELKLEEYLSDTRPKSITNNASLQLDYPLDNSNSDDSLSRAASFIHRLVRLHVDYINDDIPQPVDGRNQPISMYNWRLLTGAMRIADTESDYYYYAPKQAANRHISVLWQGHHFQLQVTDAKGNVFSTASLAEALQDLMRGNYSAPSFNFSALSALDSINTANYLSELCKRPHNQLVYEVLKDSLFCFAPYHSGADDVTQIKEQTFMPGNAWQYKPNTYQMDLDSDFVAIHFEHSEIDGAALMHMFSYAFAIELDSTQLATGSPTLTPMDWEYDSDIASRIQRDIQQVTTEADKLNVKQCCVDYTDIAIKASHDALMQFALLYAQLKVFGKVRNTYEAVDTSHFMAGRTEGLRPNSAEAIELAQSLLNNDASLEQLQSALNAHKQRVIACKTGQAFDRHLSGLKFMIKEEDNDPSVSSFFNSPGYKVLTGGDFLSTSSMGVQSPVKRILFAPVIQGGFGVNYSFNEHEYEFVLFADAISSPYLDDMCQACVEAINKLVKLTQ